MYSRVLVAFILFEALWGISANILPATIDPKDEHVAWENLDQDAIASAEELARNPTTVDYRPSQCMPPIKGTSTVFDAATQRCYYTPIYLTPLVMAEFLDCRASTQKVLRSFSVQQLQDCVYPTKPCGVFNTANYDQISVLDYILYSGLTNQSDYASASVNSTISGTSGNCLRSQVPLAYNFTTGHRTLHQLNETDMRRRVRSDGPILATMYFNQDEFIKVLMQSTFASTDLLGYKSGLLDHDAFCIPSVRASAYAEGDAMTSSSLLLSQGYQVPVMIVGFSLFEGVPVWIVRSDWFGENWGMNGYFYLKSGVNACNIALSPIQVLG